MTDDLAERAREFLLCKPGHSRECKGIRGIYATDGPHGCESLTALLRSVRSEALEGGAVMVNERFMPQGEGVEYQRARTWTHNVVAALRAKAGEVEGG